MNEINLDKLRGTKIGNMTIPPYIKSIQVTNKMDSKRGFIHCLKIDLSKDENLHEIFASAEFYNIHGQVNITMTQLLSIVIDNIKEKQWENCYYHVLDYEAGNFDFVCEKVLIT